MLSIIKNQKVTRRINKLSSQAISDRELWKRNHYQRVNRTLPRSTRSTFLPGPPEARQSMRQGTSTLTMPHNGLRKQPGFNKFSTLIAEISAVLNWVDLPLLGGLFCAILLLTPVLNQGRNSTLFLNESSMVLVLPDNLAVNQWTQATASTAHTLEIDQEAFRSLAFETYSVQPGDTISGIALRYNLAIDTLISANNITDVRRLAIGSRLKIPDSDGVWHITKSGDSLSRLASQYGVSVNLLLDKNDLESTSLAIGQALFIPGGQMDPVDRKLALGELFAMPVLGRFSSYFGYRADPFTGERRFHNGLDIANSEGTPIRAASSGRIVHIETQIGNYGKYIIVDHGRGFKTLYAHLSGFNARVGQYVDTRQIIGYMGSTGRSTGSHLHFSVIRNGNFVDPLDFLQ